MRKLFAMVIAMLVLSAWTTATTAQASPNKAIAKAAIYRHWPRAYRGEAMKVVGCETGKTYDVHAINDVPGPDIYEGLFQQGNWQRGTFGFAWDADAQAISGWKAFVSNGRCWTCNAQWPICGRGLD